VRWGHSVTWFTAWFPGAAQTENLNGIEFIRLGRQTTVHWNAWRWYQVHGRTSYDIVVDEINTIPFFTPLYVRARTVAFIPQLAREVWWQEAPLPLAPLGYLAEPVYLQAYRHTPVITISASTEASLRGLGQQGRIGIIPMATDFVAEAILPPLSDKERQLTLLFVGRVVPSKRIVDMIKALANLHQRGLPAQLWIVGNGDRGYLAQLEALVKQQGLSTSVRFLGRVSESEKRNLYSRAHLLLACSVREGWGLTVTEANSVGTPAVVYDVPGLRDSTQADRTGVICPKNTPEALADSIVRVWLDPDRYQRLRAGALGLAHTLDWDTTARRFLELLP